MAFKITELWLVVATNDDHDGDEGIVTFSNHGMMVPMVCADKERLEQVLPAARAMAGATGQTFKLIKVDHRTEISDITGEPLQ